MKTFTDAKGQSWEIALDVTALKRVKSLLSINLYDLVDDGAKKLGDLLGDPVQLIDILYVLCRDQCGGRGLTDEDFGHGFSGDALEAAGEAFVEELIDFFPNRKGRETLRKLIGKGKDVSRLILERNEQDVDSLDVALLAEKWRASSGSAPAVSASTRPA